MHKLTQRSKIHSGFTSMLLLGALILSACKQTSPPSATSAITPPVAQEASSQQAKISVEISKNLREGMSLAQLRETLTSGGWLPFRDETCFEKAATMENCSRHAEVQNCKPTAVGDEIACDMRYANARDNAVIHAVVVGKSDAWAQPGGVSLLKLSSWKVVASHGMQEANSGPARCPSSDFEEFLKAFAADEHTERVFTAPLVKVAERYSDDDGDHSRLVYVAGDRYADFNVRYSNNAYHYIDSENVVDDADLGLKVQDAEPGAKIVSYQYGMSEGNSYRFDSRDGCWVLTEDPLPPSP